MDRATALQPVIPLRRSVTIDDILQRRKKAGKLVAGTAAYSDSDMFKAPVRQIRTLHFHLTSSSLTSNLVV